MAHLIDKDALVAEIDRRYKVVEKYETNELCAVASRDELVHLKSFIDTLEVKEVDLEDNVDKILESNDWNFDKIDFYKFAEHFFELGLMVSNSTKVTTPGIRLY